MHATKLVLWTTTLVLAILEVYAIAIDSRYKWDFIFVMLMLWAVFLLRDKINLHPLHYGLLSVFLLSHFPNGFCYFLLRLNHNSYSPINQLKFMFSRCYHQQKGDCITTLRASR